MIDRDKIRQVAKLIIGAIGQDLNREGLIENHDRIARRNEVLSLIKL
ncbi:hypothetical protein JHL18_00795 [Clostridium sp. YIM B02505]|uniref:Uncharacterized protein n=1 Tax=Clostridium yunnanense TaxID=2800325 RepID=A0ABS1EIK4_9CLOT|nr:hypothetical protein [Clostridium yunnanense]MBK1809185.1 hypothetical protein [Clostridium yunnanense]